MHNIIPFPQNPAKTREDKEMAMEATSRETMAYDDWTAAAVA